MRITNPGDTVILGIDPDTKNCGFAVVDGLKVVHVGVAKQRESTGYASLKPMTGALYEELSKLAAWPISKVHVEGQKIYQTGPFKTKNPDDILLLAQVTGLAVAVSALIWPKVPCHVFKPYEWKGSNPKRVSQARICKKLGWDYEIVSDDWARPTNPPFQINPAGAWKHVMDGIGLALHEA